MGHLVLKSGSLFGVKWRIEKYVTEDMKLEPLTDYSRFKGDCEKILNSYKSEDFITRLQLFSRQLFCLGWFTVLKLSSLLIFP